MVYMPLSDEGVTTPIIMNRRREDESELTTFIREIVHSVHSQPTSILEKNRAGIQRGSDSSAKDVGERGR